jgi:hypothetical protein
MTYASLIMVVVVGLLRKAVFHYPPLPKAVTRVNPRIVANRAWCRRRSPKGSGTRKF